MISVILWRLPACLLWCRCYSTISLSWAPCYSNQPICLPSNAQVLWKALLGLFAYNRVGCVDSDSQNLRGGSMRVAACRGLTVLTQYLVLDELLQCFLTIVLVEVDAGETDCIECRLGVLLLGCTCLLAAAQASMASSRHPLVFDGHGSEQFKWVLGIERSSRHVIL